jgi:UDP-glucose-4-epimerase GalE
MADKVVMVTGGAGFIGSHATRLLLENGYKVEVVDNLCLGFREAVEVLQNKYGKENLSFSKVDLRSKAEVEQVMERVKPEAVMHFAALSMVDKSMEVPEEYFENNVAGSIYLIEAMLKNQVNKLIFSSTSAVLGNSQYLPVDEKHPTDPISAYGESKLLVEKMIRMISKIHGMKHIIFRYFNVTGSSSDGLIGDSKKPSTLLVQNAVRGALGIAPFQLVCPKVDTPDGTPIRDYINVEDLVDAHLAGLRYLDNGGESNTFLLGTGTGNSVLEIVEMVKKETGVNFEVGKGETRKGDIPAAYANIAKAKEVLGWEPKRSLGDSVASLVKWYKNKPNGWNH